MSRYRFIDRIIAAAVASTPHTSPSKNFPTMNYSWNKREEARIFEIPSRVQKPLYLSDEEYLAEDDDELYEEYEIERFGSPTKNHVKVDG